jgi:GDP-4-dehydro-6-deoxy-D-mannose reductase
MKALITGVTGFVGKYLANLLLNNGVNVVGTSRVASPPFVIGNSVVEVIGNNLDNKDEIYNLLMRTRPDFIFHLAAQSNVKKSWEETSETFYTNVNKTIFLLDACIEYQKHNPKLKILTVGSSEEYGLVETDEFPIKETTALRPMNPYGTSKSVVSSLIQQYHKSNELNVIHARPFNHIGPGQSIGFVTTDFARQIVEIERGEKEPVIKVGNLSSQRDFTDVKDIVRAYYQLVINGKVGNIYNICSSNPNSIQYILDFFIANSTKKIKVELDENRLRPSDIPLYVGSNEKIKSHTNWTPLINFETTLMNILKYERSK